MINKTSQFSVLSALSVVAFVGAMLVVSFLAAPQPAVEPSANPTFAAYALVGADGVDEAEHADAAEEREDSDAKAEAPKVQKKTKKKKVVKPEEWKAAVLQVVTNFDKADVTVNGLPYPEYVDPGGENGMVLPAGGPYQVLVTYDGKVKTYKLNLRPYETRLLIVELTGFQGGAAKAASPPPKVEKKKKEDKKKKKGEKEPGRVTVYSKPPGTIMVDGAKKSEKTPGTVEVENGRHEVQVEYESGEISEKKIVRVREGSRIKLFFRERKK